MTLYELSAEGRRMQDMLEAADGELTPELEREFDALLAAGADKLEAAGRVLRNLQVEALAVTEEYDRLQKRINGLDRQIERLKARMLAAVDAVYGGKIKTTLFTLWGQASAPRTEFSVLDGVEIRDLPRTATRAVWDLNREHLRELLKQGKPLPEGIAAGQIPGTRYLRVK